MSTRGRVTPSFPAATAASLRHGRRYSVPPWLVEAATERRVAGDWRGACAAANVDVDVDLTRVAREHGADVAGQLTDDLLHLVPDLLRWHAPRFPSSQGGFALQPPVVLAGYPAGAQRPTSVLRFRLPAGVGAPQRLRLEFGPVSTAGQRSHLDNWTRTRCLWDCRQAADLRRYAGGDERRTPFFHPDGTPLSAAELPTGPVPGDLPATTEWVSRLWDAGRVAEAVAAAGFDFEIAEPDRAEDIRTHLSFESLALTRLATGAFLPEPDRWGRLRIADALGRDVLLRRAEPQSSSAARRRSKILVRAGQLGGLDARKKIPSVSGPDRRVLPDLELLRLGWLSPADLHPMVRSALFPAWSGDLTPAPLTETQLIARPVLVRCGQREWHPVGLTGGRLRIPHDPVQVQRERLLAALGGGVLGCFRALDAWTGGLGRKLPKGLRQLRQELAHRVQHGDTVGVLRLLDAGMDPTVLLGPRRTLLHVLSLVDHRLLLPRLLAVGLDLEAHDHDGSTPLQVAVAEGGSAELIAALIAAGADRGGLESAAELVG